MSNCQQWPMPSTGLVLGLVLALAAGCSSESPSPSGPAAATEASPHPAPATSKAAPRVRKFTFHYRFRVKNLPLGAGDRSLVRVWAPCPQTTPDQEITQLERKAPAAISESAEFEFGNRILYFELPVPESGEFGADFPYRVTRREVLFAGHSELGRQETMDDAKRELFLRAETLVPKSGKPLTLLKETPFRADRLRMARQLYDLVDTHVTYKKEGTGWGRGDTEWVCDSRYGNCTDFHSLFISLARSQALPARFEIGFSISPDASEGPVTGYHCWAWFYLDDRGWVPVDISEADKHPELKDYYFGQLSADRVLFSTGRDLQLEPEPAAGPLNFFIHPHIEVGGKVLPLSHVELQFAFEQDK